MPSIIDHPHTLINTYIDHGSIQLVSIIGTGAYGVVYLGIHIHTCRRYAVKVVKSKKVAHQEIRLHARVSGHDNIIRLEKVVHQGDHIFIILEHAPDGDLFNTITKGRFNIVGNNMAIQSIFLQIIDAVQHCHSMGVSHRDLKPENIMISRDWRVRLSDFGLATTLSVSSDFGCGSTFYISPECQGKLVRNRRRIMGYSTQQSDIWSLGVILINLVAGRNPWKQATMRDVTFAKYADRPRHFFRKVLPMISDELDDILSRIFCIDPAFRISLPELRIRVLQCQSFMRHQTPIKRDVDLPKLLPSSIKPDMTVPITLTPTMQEYIGSFDDHGRYSTLNVPKRKPTVPMMPSFHTLSVSSCSTSNSSFECVAQSYPAHYVSKTKTTGAIVMNTILNLVH